jgi:hypothetical protein
VQNLKLYLLRVLKSILAVLACTFSHTGKVWLARSKEAAAKASSLTGYVNAIILRNSTKGAYVKTVLLVNTGRTDMRMIHRLENG